MDVLRCDMTDLRMHHYNNNATVSCHGVGGHHTKFVHLVCESLGYEYLHTHYFYFSAWFCRNEVPWTLHDCKGHNEYARPNTKQTYALDEATT